MMVLLLALSAGIGGAVRSSRESATPRTGGDLPADAGRGGRLRLVADAARPATRPNSELVRLVSSHDDAGGDAGRRPRGLRRRDRQRRAGRPMRWSAAAASSGPSSTIRTGTATANGPPRIQRQVVMITGSHHQQVYWYRPVTTACSGSFPACISSPSGAGFLAAPRSCIRRPSTASRRPGSWNAVCIDLPRHHGKRRVQRDPRLAADRDAGGRHDGRGARHRVRGVSWAERRTRRGRTATRCAATGST